MEAMEEGCRNVEEGGERAGGGSRQTRPELGGRKHHQNSKNAELDRLGQGCTWSQDLPATSLSGSGDSLAWGLKTQSNDNLFCRRVKKQGRERSLWCIQAAGPCPQQHFVCPILSSATSCSARSQERWIHRGTRKQLISCARWNKMIFKVSFNPGIL